MEIKYVKNLIDKAVSGELKIPEFQREYVWDKEQVKLLIDSLYRNYTINSILIWEGSNELARRRVGASISEIKFPEDDNIDQKITYLLDGQQRTTTLVSVFSDLEIFKGNQKKPIKYKLYIDIEGFEVMGNEENGIIDRLYFDDEKIQNGEEILVLNKYSQKDLIYKYGIRYIPLNILYLDSERKVFFDLLESEGKDYKEIYNLINLIGRLKENLLDRKVYVIEQGGSLEQVLDIFERINTKNTKLNMFDIMVAKTYKKIGDDYFDLRNYVNLVKSSNTLNSGNYFEELGKLDDSNIYEFNDDKEFLFIIMLFLQDKKLVREVEILKITTDILIKNYKRVNKLFKGLIDELENFKIQSGNYHKFKPIIKFFSMYISKNEDNITHEKREFIKSWFWNTLLYNRYSGSQNERIQKDFYELTLNNYKEKLLNSRARQFSENTKILEAYYDKSGSQLFAVLELLLLNNNVKDFYSGTEVNKGTENKSKLELHHIFPYNSSIGKNVRKNSNDNIINNIANLTPLTKDTNNRFINSKNPSVYIKEFKQEMGEEKLLEYLDTHLIDKDMLEMLERDDFDGFINARTKKIIEKIYELTKV